MEKTFGSILGAKPLLRSNYRSYVYPNYAGACEPVYNNRVCVRDTCNTVKALATETMACPECDKLETCEFCGDFAIDCTCSDPDFACDDDEYLDYGDRSDRLGWVGSFEQRSERQQMGITS